MKSMQINTTYNMDALAAARLLPDESVDCIVTSPPYYGLRDYGGEFHLHDVEPYGGIRRAGRESGEGRAEG